MKGGRIAVRYGDYTRRLWEMSRRLAALRGGSAARYFADAARCARDHGASPENYFVLRFFALDEAARRTFLTSGRSREADRVLNARATAREKAALGNKARFLRAFAPLAARDWVYAPEADAAAFEAFLDRNAVFFQKPVGGLMGRGIERRRTAALGDRAAFYARCRDEGLLLEAAIDQHPALARINPSCVQTVRVNAARDRAGRVVLVGACLKCGGIGAVTDNFHTGGAAYPLELQSGVVTGPGRNGHDLAELVRHPGADFDMPGFAVPHWEAVRALVSEAMARVPGMGYVGWDIAVTPTGAALVEGNFHWPGGNIIQFDNVGKYPLILRCMGERYEKLPH